MKISPSNSVGTEQYQVRHDTGARPVTASAPPAAASIVATETGSPAAAVNPATIADAVTEINEFLKPQARNVVFSVDEDSKHTVVKVVDTDTKEVIRQMPSEEALAIARALDRFQGLLVRQKA